jgi:dual specificity MAP kinase phosphatase
MSTSSESYRSSGTTEGTSPSVADFLSPVSPGSLKLTPETELPPPSPTLGVDVQMHPCESKRMSPTAQAKELDESAVDPAKHEHEDEDEDMIQGDPTWATEKIPKAWDDSEDSDEEEDEEEPRPSCVLLNALHVQDIFELPKLNSKYLEQPRFRTAKLPPQINLRNLNIQQIKYATVSDIILYAKSGVGNGVIHVAEQ